MNKKLFIRVGIALLVLLIGIPTSIVILQDRNAPSFDDIADQNVEVFSSNIDWTSLIENVSEEGLTLEETEDNVNYNIVGTYTVTVSATDDAGNKTSKTFNVNVVDTVEPTLALTGASAITLEAGATYTEAGAIYTDNYDGSGQATVGGDLVTTNVVGTYTVVYTYTDTSGNDAATVSRTVTVVDTTIPLVTMLGDTSITVQAGVDYVDAGATFNDIVDGTGNITATGTVDVNTIGTYTLTYTYTDTSGNVGATLTRTVTVVDTTAPTITLNSGNNLNVEFGTTFTDPGYTAEDNYDETVNVTVTGSVDDQTLGTYTLTYTSTDTFGNETIVTRTVNVIDTTPALLTLSGDAAITLEYGATYTEAGATFSDLKDGTGTATVSGTVDTNTLGEYTITYTYTDEAGNTSTVTRTVTVVDTTAPTITLLNGLQMNIQLTETFTDPGYTASDNVDSNLVVNVSGTVDTNTLGEYTITYTTTDSSGNSTTVTRTVTVSDAPARLAQLAPNDDSEFNISNYFVYGEYELFLITYSDHTILAIFNGDELIDQLQFGNEPNGPSDPFPTESIFQQIYAISENGILIETMNFDTWQEEAILYNWNTGVVENTLPSGFITYYRTGPNDTIPTYLIDFTGYYYVVLSGTDRGLYQFNSDLSLNLIISLDMDYDDFNIYFETEQYRLINLQKYGMTQSSLSVLLNAENGDVLSTYVDANVNFFMLGNYLIMSYYDNSLGNNSMIMQVWSSIDIISSQFVNYIYFTSLESQSSIAYADEMAVLFSDVDNQERQIRIYDNTFTRINLYTYSLNSWSIEQVDGYIVVLDYDIYTNTYALKAFPMDGTDALEFTDFGFTTDMVSMNTAYINTTNYVGSGIRPFQYIYLGYGYNNMDTTEERKMFYFKDGNIIIIDLPTDISVWGGNNYFTGDFTKVVLTSARAIYAQDYTFTSYDVKLIILDLTTDTAIVSETLSVSYNIESTNRRLLLSGNYAVYAIGSLNNYSTYETFALFNLVDGTVQSGALDEPVTANYINSLLITGDEVKISFSDTALVTSLSNFFSTYEFTTPSFGGGGSVYDIQNIINEDDLHIEMVFDMTTGPSIVVTFNGVELGTYSVATSPYQVYVYDAEGTENDNVYIGFSQDGYVIDLNDPTLTPIYGVITATGFLTVDANYFESFDILPINSTMAFNFWEYRV